MMMTCRCLRTSISPTARARHAHVLLLHILLCYITLFYNSHLCQSHHHHLTHAHTHTHTLTHTLSLTHTLFHRISPRGGRPLSILVQRVLSGALCWKANSIPYRHVSALDACEPSAQQQRSVYHGVSEYDERGRERDTERECVCVCVSV